MSTRRQFLFDCSTAVGSLALVPMSSVKPSTSADGRVPSPRQIGYTALAGQINTLFRVRLSPGQLVELKLLKAPLAPARTSLPGRRSAGEAGHARFSLIFSGPKEALLASAIHRFEHDRLGRFEMHIGPIGSPDLAGARYEAVFNQSASATSARTTST